MEKKSQRETRSQTTAHIFCIKYMVRCIRLQHCHLKTKIKIETMVKFIDSNFLDKKKNLLNVKLLTVDKDEQNDTY